jgi:hypothetical protein
MFFRIALAHSCDQEKEPPPCGSIAERICSPCRKRMRPRCCRGCWQEWGGGLPFADRRLDGIRGQRAIGRVARSGKRTDGNGFPGPCLHEHESSRGHRLRYNMAGARPTFCDPGLVYRGVIKGRSGPEARSPGGGDARPTGHDGWRLGAAPPQRRPEIATRLPPRWSDWPWALPRRPGELRWNECETCPNHPGMWRRVDRPHRVVRPGGRRFERCVCGRGLGVRWQAGHLASSRWHDGRRAGGWGWDDGA